MFSKHTSAFSLWLKCCQTLKKPGSELQGHLGWFKWESGACLWVLGLSALWVGQFQVLWVLLCPARGPTVEGPQTAQLGKTSVARCISACPPAPSFNPVQGAWASVVQPPLDPACSWDVARGLRWGLWFKGAPQTHICWPVKMQLNKTNS